MVHEAAHVQAFNQFAERALANVQVDGGADGAHELVEVAAVEVRIGVEDGDGGVVPLAAEETA